MTLDASKSRDDALMQLYDLLVEKGAPDPGGFTALDQAGKREYFRLSRRKSRARHSAALAAGDLVPTTGNVRAALADAALMILAIDAPGADQVREVLTKAFATRPGAPATIEARVKSGRLRPKLIQRRT